MSKYVENDKQTILAGDFNMAEKLFLNRKGGNPRNIDQLRLQNLNKIKNTHMIDIWQKSNPYKRNFSYHNSDNSIHSRLGRTYLSDTIDTRKCQIIPPPYSDHGSVDVIIQVYNKDQRGPGIWKLNTSILQHKIFQKIL